MKSLFIFLALSQTAFAFEPYAYDCTCSKPKKECDGIENLNFVVKTKKILEADFGSSDWEFNSAFEAKIFSEIPGSRPDAAYEGYNIVPKSYNPDIFSKGYLIVPAAAGKKDFAYLHDKKTNEQKLVYKCVGSDPESF